MNDYRTQMVWELAVELAFDCYSCSYTFPNADQNQLGFCLQQTASLLVRETRRVLKGYQQMFSLANSSLAELKRLLQISVSLGFIDEEGFEELQRMVVVLSELMH